MNAERMKTRTITGALVTMVLVATPAVAQPTGFGMGFSGGLVDIGGGDLSEIQVGPAVELALRYRLTNGLSFGFGTELAWPGSDVDEVITTSLTDFQFITVFVEPRYNFAQSESKVSPFIGGRISYGRLNFNVFTPGVATPFRADSDGVEYGGVAGVEIWLTEGVAVSLMGEISGLSFGDVKSPEPLPGLPEDLGTGTKFGVLVGLELAFL